MSNTLKISYQQKIEIKKYFLTHNRDIKETAIKYEYKYAQFYQRVKKYETNGEESLIDKCRKSKQKAN